MKTLLKLVIMVPVGVVVLAFAMANRHFVTVSFDPLAQSPDRTISQPLFVILFATLFVGILIGGVASWIAQGKWRREAERCRAEADRLGRERPRSGSVAAIASKPRAA